MNDRHFSSRLLLAAAMTFASVSAGLAHPHVQVSVRSTLVIDGTGEVKAVRHQWKFDEAYSTFASQGLDKNNDGKLDREELQALAQENVESLGEFGYFTFLRKAKDSSEFDAPKDYFLTHDGKALTLNFTLPVAKKPYLIKELRFEVYDPSYFVAFEFEKENPVAVEGGTLACTPKIPSLSPSVTSRLSQMSESFFQSMNGANAEWAVPVRFECK